jgi:hypothetical protein
MNNLTERRAEFRWRFVHARADPLYGTDQLDLDIVLHIKNLNSTRTLVDVIEKNLSKQT